jgi:PAS domain S-box-containing protein
MLGIRIDVTERKRSEDTIRQLNADISATLQAIPDLLYEMDRNGKYLAIWSKNATFLAWQREHVLGRTVSEVLAPETVEIAMATLAEADEKGYSYGKVIRVESPEKTRWFELSVSKKDTAEGSGAHFIVLSRDVTARKKAEEALRETEQKYRLLVANAGEAIFIAQDGAVKFPNPKTLEMTGYTEEELAVTPFADLIHSSERAAVIERHLREPGAGGPSRARSFRVLAKGGEMIWAQISTAEITWEDRPGTLCFMRDITEEKKLESQFLQSQKMEAIGLLAGGVAHDFNNLLQVILGYVDVLQLGIAADTADGEALGAVRQAAERAGELTRQLLAFSRRQHIQPVHLDMDELIQGVLKMIRRVLRENIELLYRPGENLGMVLADKGQLEQVLMNLCVNARDAMSVGGTLTIETENADIGADYCREHPWACEGRYVLLRVTDTGEGMDEATREQIFEPFFTTKPAGHGTGLGLATVYGIVKQHHGLIDVTSQPGAGTTFELYIPVTERRTAPQELVVKSRAPEGTETILVAEDDEVIRKLVSQILETAGYTVLVACDGEEALRLFESHRDEIDLALLDVIMPRLGGWEVMERIHAERPDIRFLFSSGYTQSALDVRLMMKTGPALLMKPYRREDLLCALREVLDAP